MRSPLLMPHDLRLEMSCELLLNLRQNASI
jgi:hypothetical protein